MWPWEREDKKLPLRLVNKGGRTHLPRLEILFWKLLDPSKEETAKALLRNKDPSALHTCHEAFIDPLNCLSGLMLHL